MRTIEKYLWKDDVMNVVFISGPHGCGKTAFMEALLEKSEVYIKDSFFLDFVNDLPAISHMSIFEKCLLRLYHRFYTAQQANLKCKKNNDNKILLVDRSIYDSIVYNTVEHNMGTLTEFQYNFLSNIEQKALEIVNPYTVILNPDSKKVVNYLEQRAKRGGREKRNRLCRREDTLEYISMMHDEYSKIAYVTVSVSKIKRKRFDSPEAVTESIEKMEDEIVSITKGYIDFLEKDEGTDRENKKISNEIIFVEEGKIIFSITDGKTHNFWFEDKAPKYPLLKNCNDDKIFAKARILFNQESEENLYQAGIYVKSAEDKVYYMAIDNDRNCILDTIGENNRKEEFDNTNEYLIKMNLEADCLKVQFISDASTKELKMMIERLAPVEVGLMVKTWGNGGFLEVDFKESQAIISNK